MGWEWALKQQVCSCYLNHPFCLSSQPTAWDSSQHAIRRVGYEETKCGKPCLTPEIFPPTECSGLWAGSINLVSCWIFSLWHGKYYSISFFKSETTSLYPGCFQKLEILGVETQITIMQGGVTPKALTCIWIEHNWSSFASPLPPTKREEGVMLWTPAWDTWQC